MHRNEQKWILQLCFHGHRRVRAAEISTSFCAPRVKKAPYKTTIDACVYHSIGRGLKTRHSWSLSPELHWLRRQEFGALVKIWKSCCCGLILNFVPQLSGLFLRGEHALFINTDIQQVRLFGNIAHYCFLAEVRWRWAVEGKINKSKS